MHLAYGISPVRGCIDDGGRPTRLVLANDLESVRVSLRMVLSREPGLEVVDVQMPEMEGLAATREIKAEMPAVAVLVLTAYDDPDYMLGAVRAGAAGFVPKHNAPVRVAEVIRTILRGDPPLDQGCVANGRRTCSRRGSARFCGTSPGGARTTR